MLSKLWAYYNEEEDFSEISTAKGSWNSIIAQVISNQSEKRYHQIRSCVVLATTVLFYVHPQMKATLSPALIKDFSLPPGSTPGFIQFWPWLLDWTHWLKGNFNDLLSQVLIRCWQTALCGTGHSWGPEWTELGGLLPLRWVKAWAAHSADRVQQVSLRSTVCAPWWHHL